jgi:hypothetical protein
MDLSADTLAALVGAPLRSARVVAFFLRQPATARRRRQGRTDLTGIRSLSSKEHGYKVVHQKGRIETVFVYVRARGDLAAFQGKLSRGLLADDAREQVLAKLGSPTRSGYADPAGCWPWDRDDSDRLSLHLSDGGCGVGLRMLTLVAPDAAP